MKVVSLVENHTCNKDIKPKHGLSLYIETTKHKILFDLGPNKTMFINALKKNIDLSLVDTVVISHGHKDHGGALKVFLKINKKAKIYIQRKAFEAHYSKFAFLKIFVGLEKSLMTNKQIILLDGDFMIDDELSLFVAKNHDKCFSPMNDVLLNSEGQDDFLHEQNLLIHDTKKVLIVGCGHSGIVNILAKVKDKNVNYCIGGYHLFNPFNKKTVSYSLIDEIANHLKSYSDVSFYTCHCTGLKAFKYLSSRLPNVKYLYCGDEIEIKETFTTNKLIAYCGLDCEKCEAYIATKNNDNILKEEVARKWSEWNKAEITPDMINCEGCRTSGVKTPFCSSLCEIRKCAINNRFSTCGDCKNMTSCQKLTMITSNNETALINLKNK